jgi:DNA replication and repair protein RecF
MKGFGWHFDQCRRSFPSRHAMLTHLKLRHLRCFEVASCQLGPGTTVFLGENAQGKTSVLEAVCVVMRLQSPRTANLADLIRFGQSEFAVSAGLGGQELLFGYSANKRRMTIDGETMRASGDYLRHSALVVWMSNDDMALVRGGSEGRRRFLDFLGSQLYPVYRPALRDYERALRARNYLLKRDAHPRWDQIDAYTRVLAEHAKVLTTARREIVARLEPYASAVQTEVSGRLEPLGLIYEAAGGDNLEEILAGFRDEELRKRGTAAGPHRDDLELTIHGMAASRFASEGQQRTTALALKVGQARLFLAESRRPPLLLLDDIFGELDPGRRNALMAALPSDSQKLITTTHLTWLEEHLRPETVYEVAGGHLSPRAT